MGVPGEPRRATARKTGAGILVVEDEVLIRATIAEQLRRTGYSVIEAANAHEAVELLRNRFEVKLIISDIRMPGSLDGVGLARLVHNEFPGVKVILTAAHLTEVDWVEHDGFFHKPHDPAQLIAHVRTLIG
jgi:CheY-like chemotaxis protein